MVIDNRPTLHMYVSSAMYENTRHFPHKYQYNWDFVTNIYMVEEMIRESRRRTPALLDAYATLRGLRIAYGRI